MAPHSETTPRSFNPRGPILDRSTIRAASIDAGNRSMRAAGRTQWNEDDFDAASDTSARLFKVLAS